MVTQVTNVSLTRLVNPTLQIWFAKDIGLVSRTLGLPFTRGTLCKWIAIHDYVAVARNAVCTDLYLPWKKNCATRYAAARVSGMKFRVRPAKETHWGRDFYGVITFQRKRNFAESQSSRQRYLVGSLFFFCSLFLLFLSAIKKNTDASDWHLFFCNISN